MYDYQELKELVSEKCGTQKELCKRIDFNESTLSRIINEGREMKYSLVQDIAKELGVKRAVDIDRIFFTKKVENKQPEAV